MKIRISELRKVIQECLLLEGEEDLRGAPTISVDGLKVILDEFKIDTAPIKLEKLVKGLNAASRYYQSLSTLPKDEESFQEIKDVLLYKDYYEEKTVPKSIVMNLNKLAQALADHFELTLSGKAGLKRQDDEDIVVKIMQRIYQLINGGDQTDKFVGLNQLPQLFNTYGMKDETQESNDILGKLSSFHSMLKSDKNSGKFKTFSNKFAKGTSGKSSHKISSSEMKTRRA